MHIYSNFTYHKVLNKTILYIFKAENHAGLKTMATSLPFLVDYSPPSLGTVLEGLPGKTVLNNMLILLYHRVWV